MNDRLIILKDTDKVKELFAGWQETMIWSCLQKVMGKIIVSNENEPQSACAVLGDFASLAGTPDAAILSWLEYRNMIMVPQNTAWAELIEEHFPDARKSLRYATRKDTVFDKEKLKETVKKLPPGYEMRNIDRHIFKMCVSHPLMNDFVMNYASADEYLEKGLGVVILKDGVLVSGASSYSRYEEGIEIEVDTTEEERNKGLAEIACASLIMQCLEKGLYPSWDATNRESLNLAERLGYRLAHEYVVYERRI